MAVERAGDRTLPDRGHPVRRHAIVAVTILAASVAIVALYAGAYPKMSPFDEFQHVDYLFKAADGDIVERGELVGQEAMREEACRGIDLPELLLPPCMEGVYDPLDFQADGINSADIHPPTYYVITAALGSGIRAIFGLDSLVTGARLVGGLWLGLGLTLIWLVAAELRLRVTQRVIVLALFGTTLVVLHATATVNPDATALPAGGLVLGAGLLWERRRLPVWTIALAAVIGLSFRSTNAVGVGVLALYLLVRAYAPGEEDASRTRREYLVAAGVALVAVVIAIGSWVAVREAVAIGDTNPVIEELRADSFPLGDVIRQSEAFLSPVQSGYPGPFVGAAPITLFVLLNALILAAAIGSVLVLPRGGRIWALSVAGALGMVLGGLALSVSGYFLNSGIVGVPPRYGISLLPALAIVVGAALRNRVVVAVVGTMAAWSVVVVLIELI